MCEAINLPVGINSLSENLIGIEKSEPTLEMRVSTLSPAKEGSLWNRREVLIRTICQMRKRTGTMARFIETQAC